MPHDFRCWFDKFMYCRQEFPDSKHGHEKELPVAHFTPRVKKSPKDNNFPHFLKGEIAKVYRVKRPILPTDYFCWVWILAQSWNLLLKYLFGHSQLKHNIKMVTPPLCFNSFKEVSHKPVLNAMLVLEGTQVDLELKWGLWSDRTAFCPPRSATGLWVLNLNDT